jgi:hypothetical protein
VTPQVLSFDDALAERDRVLEQVNRNADQWTRDLIDQAIRTLAETGRPFSANSLRPLLPDVPGALMGARFMAAARRGQIRKVGTEPSTDPGTHGHDIKVWIKAC